MKRPLSLIALTTALTITASPNFAQGWSGDNWGIRIGGGAEQRWHDNDDAKSHWFTDFNAAMQYDWDQGTYFVMDVYWSGNNEIAADSFTFRLGQYVGDFKIGGIGGVWMKTHDTARSFGGELGYAGNGPAGDGLSLDVNSLYWNFEDGSNAISTQFSASQKISEDFSTYYDVVDTRRGTDPSARYWSLEQVLGLRYHVNERFALDAHVASYDSKVEQGARIDDDDWLRLGAGFSYSWRKAPRSTVLLTPPVFYQ